MTYRDFGETGKSWAGSLRFLHVPTRQGVGTRRTVRSQVRRVRRPGQNRARSDSCDESVGNEGMNHPCRYLTQWIPGSSHVYKEPGALVRSMVWSSNWNHWDSQLTRGCLDALDQDPVTGVTGVGPGSRRMDPFAAGSFSMDPELSASIMPQPPWISSVKGTGQRAELFMPPPGTGRPICKGTKTITFGKDQIPSNTVH